jgi:ribosomal protein S18 acetylase RimI-like enzyme
VTTEASQTVSEIEEALVGHWSHLGRWTRGALIEEAGTLRYETPIAQLPYNGVIRTRIANDAQAVIASVLASFRSRNVSCLWWDHPSATPEGLGSLLSAEGLEAVEQAAGMSIDLGNIDPPEPLTPGTRYAEVLDDDQMRQYANLIVRYWELSEESRDLVEELNGYWGPSNPQIRRWLAFTDESTPIGKVLLSLAAPPGVAAIYGMSVLPEARGKGIAGALTDIVLRRAKELGCKRVVLHSSQMAVGVYERAGFRKHCDLTVYADAPLWASRTH